MYMYYYILPFMDELSALWLSYESAEDLKRKILLTTFELEKAKMEVRKVKYHSQLNEKRFHDELQTACKERDDAKLQLQQLLQSPVLMQQAVQLQNQNNKTGLTVSTPRTKPQFAGTESEHVDYLYFETTDVPSTEKSNQIVKDSEQQRVDVEEEHCSINNVITPVTLGTSEPWIDHTSRVIEKLVNGKVLPQTGRLLDAVLKAGPTLHAMMVAGPLPQWKNPPPVQPPNKIPLILPNHGLMLNISHAINQKTQKPRFSNNGQITPDVMMSPSSFRGSTGMGDPVMVDLSSRSTCLNHDQRLNSVRSSHLTEAGKRSRLI